MILFLADIAFFLEVLVFVAGIYMLHHANHHDQGKPCRLLKSGGYFVLGASLLGMACTGYYSIKYFAQGAYHHASTQHMWGAQGMYKMDSTMMGRTGMQSCLKNMQGQMMDSARMQEMQTCLEQQK
jgi:hypothetical protein